MSNARELSQIATAVVVDTDKNVSIPKNLTFTGTGNRITGDFSNATLTSCVAFQSSTTNGVTLIQAIPNGTGVSSQHRIYNNSDVNNSAFGQFFINASEVRLMSATVGTGTALPLVLSTNNTERLRIDTSGNVGIGTSSPGAKLDVNGGRSFFAANSEPFSIYLRYNGSTNGFFIGSPSADAMVFCASSGAERMRIDTSGNLLVGTTGTGAQNSYSFSYNVPSGFGAFNHVNGTGSGATYVQFNYNVSTIGNITQNGTTGVLYNTSSDYRLKTIAGNLTGYKERIMALQPKQGTWKVDGSEFKGFLAHEFSEQYPNAVSGKKDAVDKDGKPIYQGMQAGGSETIADLVAFVQELKAELDSVKAELQTLKGN